MNIKWTIKNRLLAGCGLLVAVTSAACLLGWQQAGSSEKSIAGIIQDNQTDLARLVNIQTCERDSVAASAAESNFLLRKDLAFVQLFSANLAEIRKNLESIAGATTDVAQNQAVSHALELSAQYESTFKTLVDLVVRRGLTPEDGLEGELRKAVHSIEAVVTKQGISELEVLLLQCRRHEKDYLLRGNPSYVADIAKRIEEFTKQMALFSLPEDVKKAATDSWKIYLGAMKAIVDADMQIKAKRADAQQVSAQFQKEMQALSAGTTNAILASQTNALSCMASGKNFMLVLLVIGFVLGGMAAFALTRSITEPIKECVLFTGLLAQGDFSKDVPDDLRARVDEMGDLARAFHSMVGNTRKLLREVSDGMQTLGSSATELSAVFSQTTLAVKSMSEKTCTVAAAAQEASANTVSVAASMEEASTNLSSVAAATEEMTATVKEIATNAENARRISGLATEQFESISKTMQQLGAAAKEIDKVTESITKISSQTNLLALNATIEAASAGEAGRGFAVVANEIKVLARQTATATENIKEKIAGVQASTESAITGIEKISGVINDVGSIIVSIAAAIEEQSSVTKSVSGNVAQAALGVKDSNERIAQTANFSKSMASDLSRVNVAVDDIRHGGEQVQTSTLELSKLAEQLRATANRFKV